jgi:hypothetical protein
VGAHNDPPMKRHSRRFPCPSDTPNLSGQQCHYSDLAGPAVPALLHAWHTISTAVIRLRINERHSSPVVLISYRHARQTFVRLLSTEQLGLMSLDLD